MDWCHDNAPTASINCTANVYLEWLSGKRPTMLPTNWAVSGSGGRGQRNGLDFSSSACHKETRGKTRKW